MVKEGDRISDTSMPIENGSGRVGAGAFELDLCGYAIDLAIEYLDQLDQKGCPRFQLIRERSKEWVNFRLDGRDGSKSIMTCSNFN